MRENADISEYIRHYVPNILLLCNEDMKDPFIAIGGYAEDGRPGEVWLLCNFYRDPLRP